MIPKQTQTKQDWRKVGENASATETNWKTVKFLMRSEERKVKRGAGQKFLQTLPPEYLIKPHIAQIILLHDTHYKDKPIINGKFS